MNQYALRRDSGLSGFDRRGKYAFLFFVPDYSVANRIRRGTGGLMLIGHFAIVVAALFTGAAVYINIAEQPARLDLADAPLLAQWKSAYKRGLVMQASLALVGFALGLLAWWITDDWRWALGAVVLVANWPYTLLGMLPTNNKLMATEPALAGPETRKLIITWGSLHAVRSALGALATAIFIWAAHA